MRRLVLLFYGLLDALLVVSFKPHYDGAHLK